MPISEYLKNLRARIGHDVLLTPGVAAVIVNDRGEVLLQRRSDDGRWGLPGGAMEPGEEPAETLVREVREETALEVVPERIVGVYSGPDFRVRYGNGDEAMIGAKLPTSRSPISQRTVRYVCVKSAEYCTNRISAEKKALSVTPASRTPTKT